MRQGALLLLFHVVLLLRTSAAADPPLRLQQPRSTPTLSDIIGLDVAKTVLSDAVVLPSQAPPSVAQLFRRSADRAAVLLVGPSGLGKLVVAEAAAAAAGAEVLKVLATEAEARGFCQAAMAGIRASERPVVVLIESLETRPTVSWAISQCLRDAEDSDLPSRLFIVATLGRQLQHLGALHKTPFGHVAQLASPTEPERKQYLKQLFTQISRVDPQWGSALREAAVGTLSNLTVSYTFSEIDLLVRRAFLRSSNNEGTRDPVALHHFEQILSEMSPDASRAFHAAPVEPAVAPIEHSATDEGSRNEGSEESTKKPKDTTDAKDPMDGIFGRFNAILPEALHLPPVVWAMIIFGIISHFMAQSTYQSYGNKKRRGGGAGARSALFGAGDGQDPMAQFAAFGDRLGGPGGNPFANFPPPPNMPRAPREADIGEGLGAADAGTADAPNPTSAPSPLQPQ